MLDFFFNALRFHGGRAGGEEARECVAESRWIHPCMLTKSFFDGPKSVCHVGLIVLHHPPVGGGLLDLRIAITRR